MSFRTTAALALASSIALTGCPGPDVTDGGIPDDVPGADVLGTDGGRDAPIPLTVPVFRNPVATPDAELAQMALRIMGAPEAGATAELCNDCHSLNRAQMRYWSALTINGLEQCIPDVTLAGGDAAATAVVDCIRGGDSRYNTHNIGVLATAGDLPWFQYTFAHGGPAGEHAVFLEQAAMPRDYPALSQEQFDILAEWFLRGVPNVDDILPAESLPTTCEPMVTGSMVDYINERATNSWTTVNAANGMLMYGCAGATDALDCLADETLSSSTGYGADWDDVAAGGVAGTTSRVLFTTPYSSAYWTRSSADGRFVSHGAGARPAFRFIDLASGTGPESGRVIGADADYDPFFFPDDSGFVSQSGDRGARMCPMSVLTTGMPTMITFNETGCSGGAGIGLYEHLGAALDGSDYWAIDSVTAGVMSATYDNGGQEVTNDNPSVATFSTSSARSTVRFFANTGAGFDAVSATRVDHPFEGDAVVSPSTGLLLMRAAGAGRQLGFSTHLVASTGTGAERELAITLGGRYCTLPGGKPGFSYDERFFVYHHYIENTAEDAMELGFTGTSDPGFAEYRTRAGANIYLVDMSDGAAYRITNMGPGQYAFSPFFRSDGWIYYMVRTEGETPEYVVANDAALRLPPL